jgi:hypothetical protein
MSQSSMTKVEGGIAPPRANVVQDLWPVFVCYNGLATYHPQSRELVDPIINPDDDETVWHNEDGIFLIPSCRRSDRLLGQPPLGIRLTREEVLTLLQSIEDAADTTAITDYGPEGQDKVSNQDFALACTFRQETGTNFQFSAIADGVSLGNFWPERAARLAVLIAWRVSGQFITQNKVSKEYMEEFQSCLRTELISAFVEDRALLIRCGNPAPPNWNEELFLKHHGRDDLWYKTTLLVALVGPSGGFVLAVGDGGVVVEKETPAGKSRTVLLQTSDSVQINTVVSPDIEKLIFRPAANIGIDLQTSVRITCCSDGLDRSVTLDPTNQHPDSPILEGSATSSADLLKEMKAFYGSELEDQPDNISFTKITWPPTSPGNLPVRNRRLDKLDDVQKNDLRRKLHIIYGVHIEESQESFSSQNQGTRNSGGTPGRVGSDRELISNLYSRPTTLGLGSQGLDYGGGTPTLSYLISICRVAVHEIMAAEEEQADVILGNIERLVTIPSDNKLNKDWVNYYTIALFTLFSYHNSTNSEHRKVMAGLYDDEIQAILDVKIKSILIKTVRNDEETYRKLTKVLDILFSATLHTLSSGDIEEAFRAR